MSVIPLRQRSATEIVDAAFQVFRREPTQFLLVTAIIYVPWLLIELALSGGDAARLSTSPVLTLVLGLGSLVVGALVGGVTTVLASDVYLGIPTDVARSFRTVAGRIGSLVVAQILVSLLVGVGMFFLFVPGFYFLARFITTGQVVVLEQRSVGEALSRASRLSAGTKRHILNTILLVGLLIVAIWIGAAVLDNRLPSVLALTVTTILASVLYPLFGITETLIYYDLRIRIEGFDVEYLASGSSSAPLDAPSAQSI